MSQITPPSASPSKQEELVVDKKNGTDSWFSMTLLLLGILALIAMMFPKVLTGEQAFFYRDAGIFNYPTHYFQRDCMARGELPLWNPFNDCGIPFLAQWNVMALYPLSLIYVWLPMPGSIILFSFLHFFIGAAGIYRLTFRWTENRFAACVAGLTFAWNGLTLHNLMWPNSCASLAWSGWVLLFVDKALREGKRNIVYAALLGALQMLCGVPEIILVTWVVAMGLCLLEIMQRRNPWKIISGRFLGVGLLVFGIAAAQMLPFLDLLFHSQRNASYADVEHYAMPIWGWANFFVPLFRTSPSFLGVYLQDEQQWASSYYLGVGVMALAAIAVFAVKQARVRMLAVIALIGCILALGKSGILYAIVQKVFPFLGVMRYPVKWVQLATLCLPILAGFGADWLQNQIEKNRQRTLKMLIIIGSVTAMIILVVIGCGRMFPRPDEPFDVVLKNGLVRLLFLGLTLGILYQFVAVREMVWKRVFGVAVLLFLGLDICTHMPPQNPTVSPSSFRPIDLKMEGTMPELGVSRAMIGPEVQAIMRRAGSPKAEEDFKGKRMVLYASANLLDRIPKVNGMFSLHIKEQDEIESELASPNPQDFPEALAGFVGVSQMCENMARGGFNPRWRQMKQYLPMLTLGQQPVFASDVETKLAITGRRYNPAMTVYLPPEAQSEIGVRNYVDGANILADQSQGIPPPQFTANRISYVMSTPAPAMAVVAQTYYHAWKAYVDGRPTKIYRANLAFQAIEVPEGQHVISFVYEDDSFRAGLLVSGGCLLLCVILWFRFRKSPASAVKAIK